MPKFSANTPLQRLSKIAADIAARHGLSHRIEDQDSLVDCGMTSMAMVDLMLATEADFDILIPQQELTPTNFQSVAKLAALIDRLLTVPA